jgi:hypothetical protein
MHESGLAQSRLTEMSAYLSALTRSGYTPGCPRSGNVMRSCRSRGTVLIPAVSVLISIARWPK